MHTPNSKVHGAIMGPIWGRQDPGGPHGGPMNFAISDGSVALPVLGVRLSFVADLHDAFANILQGSFYGTRAIIWWQMQRYLTHHLWPRTVSCQCFPSMKFYLLMAVCAHRWLDAQWMPHLWTNKKTLIKLTGPQSITPQTVWNWATCPMMPMATAIDRFHIIPE